MTGRTGTLPRRPTDRAVPSIADEPPFPRTLSCFPFRNQARPAVHRGNPVVSVTAVTGRSPEDPQLFAGLVPAGSDPPSFHANHSRPALILSISLRMFSYVSSRPALSVKNLTICSWNTTSISGCPLIFAISTPLLFAISMYSFVNRI